MDVFNLIVDTCRMWYASLLSPERWFTEKIVFPVQSIASWKKKTVRKSGKMVFSVMWYRFIFKKRAEQTKNIQKLQNDTLQMCKLMIASIWASTKCVFNETIGCYKMIWIFPMSPNDAKIGSYKMWFQHWLFSQKTL